jgi:hypothetical protein
MITAERPKWNMQTYHERAYGVGSATMVPDEVVDNVEVADFCGVALDQKPALLFSACVSEPTGMLMFVIHSEHIPYEDTCFSLTQTIGASGSMSILPVDQGTFTQTMTGAGAEPIISAAEEDLLDWDFALVAPSNRPSGVVRATLRFAGRSKPIPEEELRGE